MAERSKKATVVIKCNIDHVYYLSKWLALLFVYLKIIEVVICVFRWNHTKILQGSKYWYEPTFLYTALFEWFWKKKGLPFYHHPNPRHSSVCVMHEKYLFQFQLRENVDDDNDEPWSSTFFPIYRVVKLKLHIRKIYVCFLFMRLSAACAIWSSKIHEPPSEYKSHHACVQRSIALL